MTKIVSGCVETVSNEEDIKFYGQGSRFILNPPPADGRCSVCGMHISKLKPFGGPGDPVKGDFSGARLVRTYRPDNPLPDEINEIYKRAKKEKVKARDFESWLAASYSDAERKTFLEIEYDWDAHGFGSISASWECRDCIVLRDNEYFKKLDQRYQERGDE